MHPRRKHIHETRTLGERLADGVAGSIGSWGFVIGQSVLTLVWIVANSIHGWAHWDDYPFVLLNLCYSFQAGFTGPILLLASNRQAAKDRMRDDTEAQEVELLYQINRQQLEILTELRQQRQAESASGNRPARNPKNGQYMKASAARAE